MFINIKINLKKINAQNKIINNAYNEVEKFLNMEIHSNFLIRLEIIQINDTKLLLSKFTLSPLNILETYIQYHNQNLFLINGNGDLFFIIKKF